MATAKKTYVKPSVQTRQRCLIDGCARWEEKAGLCSTHRKRKVLEQPLDAPINESYSRPVVPSRLLIQSALQLAEVDTADDEAWRRAVRRLNRAAVRFAGHRQRRG